MVYTLYSHTRSLRWMRLQFPLNLCFDLFCPQYCAPVICRQQPAAHRIICTYIYYQYHSLAALTHCRNLIAFSPLLLYICARECSVITIPTRLHSEKHTYIYLTNTGLAIYEINLLPLPIFLYTEWKPPAQRWPSVGLLGPSNSEALSSTRGTDSLFFTAQQAHTERQIIYTYTWLNQVNIRERCITHTRIYTSLISVSDPIRIDPACCVVEKCNETAASSSSGQQPTQVTSPVCVCVGWSA